MAKRLKSRTSEPIVIREDEACVLKAGDTRYWYLTNDEETEALAEGRVTPSLRERARGLMAWKKHNETIG